MGDQVVKRIRDDLYKTNSISTIGRLVRILDYFCSDYLEENLTTKKLPDEENIFNLFKEILTAPVLYNKQGMGQFFDFLYLQKLNKTALLDIIYKYFNNYPDYSGENNFISTLLINIKCMYEETAEDYDVLIYFMARLSLNTTEEKRGIIDIIIYDDKLEAMIKRLETIQ